MYTGLQLSTDFQIRINQSRAANVLSPEREKDCLRVGLIRAIESRYRDLINQSSLDEISKLVKAYEPFTPNNNQVLIKPLQITTVALASGTTFNITFDRPHNLPIGWTGLIQVENIEGSLLFSNLNGERTGTYVSSNAISITVSSITGTHTAGTGQVSSLDNSWCSDYYHFLAAKVKVKRATKIKVVSVQNTTGAKVVLVGTNNIRKGELLNFSTFGGLTGLSGDKYVDKIGDWKITIYDDKDLTVPTVITGTYTSGGVISRYFEKSVQPLASDQEIDSFEASELFPMYKTFSNKLICYTSEMNQNSDLTQEKYYLDYITTASAIDTTNDTYDLLQVYNMSMINSIIEESAIEFYKMVSNETNIKIAQTTK